MLNPRTSDPRIERYRLMQTPLVLVGRPDPAEDSVCYVDNDNVDIGFQVGNYLLRNGHDSLLFMNAAADMTVAADREKGLIAAFRKHGVPADRLKVMHYSRKIHGNPTEYGYQALRESAGSVPFTAIVTDTDRVALGALQAAETLGLRIPDDVSMIALSNDAVLAQATTPRLTSVELSAESLGTEAAKMLLKTIGNPGFVERKIVAAKLVIRDSCKPRA